ncbi:MAG: hypothetical protein D6788_01275 [Planctomycetota bacterium]|nr:MAG: hypothetical protein D6788_01275 [Planctomycetota bacterium]
MSTVPPLDVKVVYSASKRRRRSARRPVDRGTGGTGRLTLLAVGAVHLLLAGGIYYGTWWWADPELRIRVLLNVPMPDVDLRQFDRMFENAPPPGSTPTVRTPPPSRSAPPPDAAETTRDAALFVGTFYGWEALSTLAAAVLALAAGVHLGRAGGRGLERTGMALTILLVLAWGAGIYYLWSRYGIRYRVVHLRYAVGGLVAVFLCAGMWLSRGHRGINRLSAVLLILSALGTAFGLYVGLRFQAFRPADFPYPFWACVALAFVGQSLWGWLMLPLSGRLRP